MKWLQLSEFLEEFYPISLHHTHPSFNKWVFWRANEEGSENDSSCSADLGTHDKIKSALSNIRYTNQDFCQFWAPVTIGGRRLLSTSDQPFAVLFLFKEHAKYRLYSMRYKYNIDDVNNDDPMIKSGGPASAFLNCRIFINKFQNSIMVPICFPSQTNCIGVLEYTVSGDYELGDYELGDLVLNGVNAVKKAGLDVFYVQRLIPYKTINGLQVTKDEIQKALKVVCESHNLDLAQVWIPYQDKINDVPFSYSVEDTQARQLFAIKLAGYLYAREDEFDFFEPYFRFGDVTLRAIEEVPYLVTLDDYESRHISTLRSDMLEYRDDHGVFPLSSALAICLRSNGTGDLNYAFEFIWTKRSNYVNLLETIILTLKRCLPRFKFSLGEELGDEVNVIDQIETSTGYITTERLKIFQGKRSLAMQKAMEEGKKPLVVDDMVPSERTCKTTRIELPREVIEKQFGRTQKEAANNLKVSESTLKRKCRDVGILVWPGPPNVGKRKANDSSVNIQINVNEEDNGAIQEPSTININQNNLTIKAKLGDDMIKFRLPILQATFIAVQKEIGMRFNLSLGTYKLKYRDEVGDWILLQSDEDMSYCIDSSSQLDPNEVRLRVVPSSTQPIHIGAF